MTFTPATTAALVGVGIGAVHFLAHTLAGDEDKFKEAGVETAGIGVSIAGAVATYIVLVLTGVA